jgi:hypothetical protein
VVTVDDLDDILSPATKPVPLADQTLVSNARHELETATRDLAGFIEGDSPHLSIQQAVWVATRSGTLTDAEACAATGLSDVEVGIWKRDPRFVAVLEHALSNKREGFKLLGTHILPKALLKIAEKLDSSNERVSLAAAKLLSETQGMLITSINKQSRDSVIELVAFLREPQPVAANTNPKIVVRGLPSPEDLENAE